METPSELLDQLVAWANRTAWLDWVALGGSLGRGAGDRLSDIDAGAGVLVGPSRFDELRDETLAAVSEFATVADSIIQPLGTEDRVADHLIVQYRDGRQLSLVVSRAEQSRGLAPQSLALVDKSGRLLALRPTSEFDPDPRTLREWSFVAWISLGDAARHASRGAGWRAVQSLTEARDLGWQLFASDRGIPYPAFGAVSVQNAGLATEAGMDATLPTSLARDDLLEAVRALATVLVELTAGRGVDGLRDVAMRRIDELGEH
ncbi:MAG TPA: hypothetical protein VHZ81_11440 [Galbitalea sp.]|jgi:hypothetical protein|nr:hypothetical protein [Galbitalea sp.]